MPPSVPPKLAGLAELCWHQNPEQRPEFNEVRNGSPCVATSAFDVVLWLDSLLLLYCLVLEIFLMDTTNIKYRIL